MEDVLVKTSSSVGESNLHLQLTPAYRRDVFGDKNVWSLAKIYIEEKLKKMNILLLAADGGPDHAHFFLANWKNYSIPYIVNQVKGFSSYMMRKHHWNLFRDKLWGKKFWSEGYFYRTVGAVTKESTKFYIEKSQKKHWKALDYDYYKYVKSNQMLLTSFSS